MSVKLAHQLDRFSAWGGTPTGPTLRLFRWRYQVLVWDWVSIVSVLGLGLGYTWWTGGGLIAFGIAAACGVLGWIAAEAWYA